VKEIGDALIGELAQRRHVGHVRDDGDSLLAGLVDDGPDHIGRESRVRHPDLDDVDVLRLQIADVLARFVRRRRLERRRSWIRAADAEPLAGGVGPRRQQRAAARLCKERHRLRLVISRRSHCRDAPAQLSEPVALHVLRRLIDVAVGVDEAGHDDLARRVDDCSAARNLHPRTGTHGLDPIAVDEYDGIGDRRRARAVDQSCADDGGQWCAALPVRCRTEKNSR
jgi:hypothetical protein